MNYSIEEGDYVRHENPSVNGGLRMNVEEISEDGQRAKCSHFAGNEATHKVDWFPLTDLTLVQKADGGFVD
ncbi:hypothetical protein HH214_01420 [Mucilaginibacter robiniae]|uniref:DUF2158 domain-containing protein n=1 Tax=Mucilaginibacter robiniae TaxID=2728022 RepID=A0A7L5DU90_9SPHI|nr:hypothetical protein [Mucilaginibacter robiniae]QJD94622.1 hypothetical protein HH214_01420 [Mucilaginibacter robiniae]